MLKNFSKVIVVLLFLGCSAVTVFSDPINPNTVPLQGFSASAIQAAAPLQGYSAAAGSTTAVQGLPGSVNLPTASLQGSSGSTASTTAQLQGLSNAASPNASPLQGDNAGNRCAPNCVFRLAVKREATPEPSTFLLLGLGVFGIGCFSSLRNRKKSN
jgi:hypothetical protein